MDDAAISRGDAQGTKETETHVREMYTARLERKVLLSEAAQCYHFEFVFTAETAPALEAGQFLSLLADAPGGKTYTRAYSIASAPRGAAFDLCVNRVEGGFFSNLLCDLAEGDTVQCHGPHGLFTLRRPVVDGLMIAEGTGIAPLRGFLQWLFPAEGPDRSGGREYWLIYEAARPGEHFYDSDFGVLAARHANFHYLPVVGSDGVRDDTTQAIARIATETRSEMLTADEPAEFAAYAYVCGLSEMVKTVRTQLLGLGWQRRQVLFERYD